MDHKRRSSYNRSGNRDPFNGNNGAVRNSLSNTMTSKNKLELSCTAAGHAGAFSLDICSELGGSGLVSACYFNARHKFSPRGRVIGEDTRFGIELAGHVGAEQAANEAVFLTIPKLQKYNVGLGYEIGTNCSHKVYTAGQYCAIGLKSAITKNISPERGLRLADMGVSYLLAVENELNTQSQQHWIAQAAAAAASGNPLPPPPLPVGIDEVKAACMLSLLLAHENRNRVPASRYPVDEQFGEQDDIPGI